MSIRMTGGRTCPRVCPRAERSHTAPQQGQAGADGSSWAGRGSTSSEDGSGRAGFLIRGDVGGPGAAGEQAVVADAVEAVGEHVEQEAADDLPRTSCA